MNEAVRKSHRFPALGCLVIVLIVVGLVLSFRGPALPHCAQPELDAARKKWEQAGIDSYALEVEVRGRQAAVYEVEVAAGEVTAAKRNGEPLRTQRTLGTWSVPGMFGTLEADVENQARLEAGRAGPEIPWVDLYVEFEPQLGYPLRCLRVQSGGAGANPEVWWEVRRFERK